MNKIARVTLKNESNIIPYALLIGSIPFAFLWLVILVSSAPENTMYVGPINKFDFIVNSALFKVLLSCVLGFVTSGMMGFLVKSGRRFESV